MTQIDDLVKRLREFRPIYGWPEEYATAVTQSLGDAAADALESQSAEITRLRERNAELEKVLAGINIHKNALLRQTDSLRAELERAKEALEAEDKLIRDAQEKLCTYLHPGSGVDDRQIANEMLEHFDGSRQREVQKQASAVLAASESAVGKSEGEKDGE